MNSEENTQDKEAAQDNLGNPEYVINSESDLKQLAKTVLALAIDFKLENASTDDGAVLVALQGDLGSGKTTFTKILAEELGITEHIMSPTFVILKKYSILDKMDKSSQLSSDSDLMPFSQLIHIDAYRLQNPEELAKLGWNGLMKTSSLICLEWPELVADILPESYIKVKFEHIFESESEQGNRTARKVTVSLKV